MKLTVKGLNIKIEETGDDMYTVYVNNQVLFQCLSKREVNSLTISCILEQLIEE